MSDFSFLYQHTHHMLDGESAASFSDYRRLSDLLGLPKANISLEKILTPGVYDFYIRMATAGIAGGMAQSSVNPFETVKVRLQNEGSSNAVVKKYRTFGNGFKVILQEEGILGLWKGTIPAVARELIYTSSRMGLYKPIKDNLLAIEGKHRKPGPERIWEKLVAGGTSGGLAAFIGNPSDLLKARMQASASGKLGVGDYMREILRKQGVAGFWTGASATVMRAVRSSNSM